MNESRLLRRPWPSCLRRALVLAPLLAVLLVLLPGGAKAESAAAQSQRAYLVSAHSRMCLEIYGFSQLDFATANQWFCWGSSNQTLQINQLPDGFFELRFAHSNKCLEVLNYATWNGAPVGQYTCYGGDNQRWSGQFVDGATFVIRNKFNGKCLDLFAGGRNNGDRIVQWDCHFGGNQQWQMWVPGEATSLRVVSQVCVPDNRVSVTFAWSPSNRGNQWLDLSLHNNNFTPRTFIGLGPLAPDQSQLTWSGLLAGSRHYLRVNTLTASGWRPSSTLAFDTRSDCAAAGPATVVRKLPTADRVISLTFDAGSDAGYTQMILDTLARNGIKADFGITGKWAETYPDLTRRIAADGHGLINHSYDHASFTGFSTGRPALSRSERRLQLSRTEDIVWRLTGRSTKPYFRPPYGDYDASVNADVGAEGYRFNVMWTIDSYGWRRWSSQDITNRVLSLAEPGAIVIFHVGSESQDGPALQAIIDGLRRQGYSFVLLDQYLR